MQSQRTTKKLTAKKYENKLGVGNDTEGPDYGQTANRLLIACKEDGEIDKTQIDGKAFYSFDLTTKKLNPSPIFVISL